MKKLLTLFIMLSLTACNLPGLGGSTLNDDIVIASGNTTERQIIAEVISQMITHYEPDIRVDTLSNLGSSVLIQQALLRGDANISAVMYTGTSLTGELNQPAETNTEIALEKVVKGYDEAFDLLWMPSFGFANSYAFMVSRDFSLEHDITKISDLEKMAYKINAGIDTGWMDRDGDGYVAFKELYGFEFKRLSPMDIGLVYSAIESGTMDVVLGYSTDGRIDAYDLVVLEDDLELFPAYDASLVISHGLYKEYPQLEAILLKLENSISNEMMQKLNRISDEERIEPKINAKNFLEENNYFEDVEIQKLEERETYQDIMKGLKS